MNISKHIDFTLVKPTALAGDIKILCEQAIQQQFAAVCVPPLFVKLCKELLAGTSIKTSTVIGFPFGYSAVEAKLAEIILTMVDGADELDVVINYMAIKNNDWAYLANEINHILPVIKKQEKAIKLILEAGELSENEIIKCCQLYGPAEIDFMQTSTGFANNGDTLQSVKLMKQNLPDHIQIKAVGTIETKDLANELIASGASRIGVNQILQ